MNRSPKSAADLLHSSRPPKRPGDPFEATRNVAIAYGVDKLAPLMGRAPGTLYNKLNANESSHHQVTLADFIQVSLITGDYSPLHALNHTLGHCCFRVPDCAQASDEALLELINRISIEDGDFHRAVNIALEDRRFSRADFRAVQEEALQFIGAIAEALRRIEGLVDE